MSLSDPTTFDVHGVTAATSEFSLAILGPSVVGWQGQVILAAVALSWTYDYLRSDLYRKDPVSRRRLLWWCSTFCTLQAILNFYLIFKWTTKVERDAESILRPSTINALQPLSVALVGMPIQVFLSKRATGLLHTRWIKITVQAILGIAIILEGIAVVFNVVLNLLFNHGKLNGTLLDVVTYNFSSAIWLCLSAFVDIGVSVVLVVVLRKKIVGFSLSTDGKLRALVWLSVQSASFTAVIAANAAVASFASGSNNLLWTSVPFAFQYLLPSLYLFSLLLSLSSRLLLVSPLSAPSLHPRQIHVAGLPSHQHGGAHGDNGMNFLGSTGGGGNEMARRSPYLRGATPSPSRMREEKGRGIRVQEHVSVLVGADVDEYELPVNAARGRLPVSTLSKHESTIHDVGEDSVGDSSGVSETSWTKKKPKSDEEEGEPSPFSM